MDPDFWPVALRDFGLLVAGSGIAYLSGTLAAGRVRKDEAEARARTAEAEEAARTREQEQASREAMKDLARRLLPLLATLRGVTTEHADPYRGWDFPAADVDAVRDAAILIHDDEIRKALEYGCDLLGKWQRLAEWAVNKIKLDSYATAHDTHVLNSMRNITAAMARGDEPAHEDVHWLTNTGSEIFFAQNNYWENTEDFHNRHDSSDESGNSSQGPGEVEAPAGTGD